MGTNYYMTKNYCCECGRSEQVHIDKRYGSMRATLLIGNIRENELVAALGPSIIDRSRDGGGIIFCDWPSLRGAA